MTNITCTPFFLFEAGQSSLYTLKNQSGMAVSVTDWGAYLVSVLAPDRSGRQDDVILSYNDAEGFFHRPGYYGATVGRNCNRIAGAQVELEGRTYRLPQNDHGNNLHSGPGGLDHKLWSAQVAEGPTGQELVLTAVSADGEDGFPGNLRVRLTVSLDEQNGLQLHYQAETDADTLCNLTNHAYFNLNGHYRGDILGHELRVNASRFAETDEQLIPTGRLLPVEGTPLDFRTFHAIGERIDADCPALRYGGGYDQCWVLADGRGVLGLAAELYDPASGRRMECWTDQPAIQVYSGNGIDPDLVCKGGVHYCKRAGVALETQLIPDAIHHPEWDSPVLRPGEKYDSCTIYRFFAE